MFRRIIAQARKELTQIMRDRLALALALVLPLFLLLLLSNAISLTVNDLPLIVQDLDNSAASRSYIDVAARTGGVVQVLNDQRQVVDRQRNRVAEQKQEKQRQYQGQSERQPVAHDLGQFLAGLGNDSPEHLILLRKLAVSTGFLDHGDENVL